MFPRVIWIVLDSVGIGAMPDAAAYGDAGSDTLGNIVRAARAERAQPVRHGSRQPEAVRRASARSTSHRSLRALRAGLARQRHDHRTLGDGRHPSAKAVSAFSLTAFRRDVMEPLERRIGRSSLGNKAASGTEIIKELGEEHMRTGSPIVYTSADSVFQVAAHEDVIPLWELYRICEIAREILRGPYEVGRVIARPFTATPGAFHDAPRTATITRCRRRAACCSISWRRAGVPVYSVGKIFDVFLGRGIRDHVKTKNNADGMPKTPARLQKFPPA